MMNTSSVLISIKSHVDTRNQLRLLVLSVGRLIGDVPVLDSCCSSTMGIYCTKSHSEKRALKPLE